MKRSKFNGKVEPSQPRKGGQGRWEADDNEEEFSRRKAKKSGKRFHRQKTLREEFWDDLGDKD